MSFPNIDYEDFTFTLDKEAIKNEIDKVVIEAKPDSKLIKGEVILDIPKITKNQRDELGTVKETIEELSFLSDKIDKNITNIDKWETSNNNDGGAFTNEAKVIKEISENVKEKNKNNNKHNISYQQSAIFLLKPLYNSTIGMPYLWYFATTKSIFA
nr:hypothetical protein [Mycoplasmopsis bovis]